MFNQFVRIHIAGFLFSMMIYPAFVFANADFGSLGANPGLDFYSRIDDAGDALAQGIIKRRLGQYKTYQDFGCGQAAWLAQESVRQKELEQIGVGNYSHMMSLASAANSGLNTDQLTGLADCISQKYRNLQEQSYQDQDALETIANVGLYMDGDTSNSDYDIVADIKKINAIIFKKEINYKGSPNNTKKLLNDYVKGKSVAPLFSPTSKKSSKSEDVNKDSTEATNTHTNEKTQKENENSETKDSTTTNKKTTSKQLPWTTTCTDSKTLVTGENFDPTKDASSIFTHDMLDGLSSTSTTGVGGEGIAIHNNTSGGPQDSQNQDSTSGPSLDASSDFYDKHPCSDGAIFCITINKVMGSSNLLGGSSNNSIETILEKHIKMMDKISWSDLSQQKMTNNTFQLPFMNVKIKSKIAGGRIFTYNEPQPNRNLKKEDTPQKKEDEFEKAYKCAMISAGLPANKENVNGFGGAGIVSRVNLNTENVNKSITSLTPTSMDQKTMQGCYDARIQEGRKKGFKSFSTDLNEIEAFTQAMTNIILEIFETDKKLDNLPVK